MRIEKFVNGLLFTVLIFFSITILNREETNFAIKQISISLIILAAYYYLIFKVFPSIWMKRVNRNWILVVAVLLVMFIFLELINGVSLSVKYYQKYYRVSSFWNCISSEEYGSVNHLNILLISSITIVWALIYSYIRTKGNKILITI